MYIHNGSTTALTDYLFSMGCVFFVCILYVAASVIKSMKFHAFDIQNLLSCRRNEEEKYFTQKKLIQWYNDF